MTKYERLYTADEVDGMIARATAKAAQQPLMEPEGKCKECLTYNGHQDGCSHATPPAAAISCYSVKWCCVCLKKD